MTDRHSLQDILRAHTERGRWHKKWVAAGLLRKPFTRRRSGLKTCTPIAVTRDSQTIGKLRLINKAYEECRKGDRVFNENFPGCIVKPDTGHLHSRHKADAARALLTHPMMEPAVTTLPPRDVPGMRWSVAVFDLLSWIVKYGNGRTDQADRLVRCIVRGLCTAAGEAMVVIVGCDSGDLPAKMFEKAVRAQKSAPRSDPDAQTLDPLEPIPISAWMASPLHRRLLVTYVFEEVFGMLSQDGIYRGHLQAPSFRMVIAAGNPAQPEKVYVGMPALYQSRTRTRTTPGPAPEFPPMKAVEGEAVAISLLMQLDVAYTNTDLKAELGLSFGAAIRASHRPTCFVHIDDTDALAAALTNRLSHVGGVLLHRKSETVDLRKLEAIVSDCRAQCPEAGVPELHTIVLLLASLGMSDFCMKWVIVTKKHCKALMI